MVGFTTVRSAKYPSQNVEKTLYLRPTFTNRDLGTEGAEDADISLRKCLSGPNALIPGPRYFCANRAIVCTGSYGEHFSSFHDSKTKLIK